MPMAKGDQNVGDAKRGNSYSKICRLLRERLSVLFRHERRKDMQESRVGRMKPYKGKLTDYIRREDAIKALCKKTCCPGVLCPDGYCVEVRGGGLMTSPPPM